MVNEETEITPKTLLDEIIKSRNELRNIIDAAETRLLLKIEELNFKIRNLEQENGELREENEKLKRANKKNAIVIFGINNDDELCMEFICSKLKDLLQVEVLPEHISDFYPLGNEKTSPLKIVFVHSWKKGKYSVMYAN